MAPALAGFFETRGVQLDLGWRGTLSEAAPYRCSSGCNLTRYSQTEAALLVDRWCLADRPLELD